jgi:hypothetical protein
VASSLLPDALVPDALVPDALVPDALVPDALVPDALVPDTLVPDTLVPGPRLSDGGPDDVITVPNLQAIREPASTPAREPVLAAVGSHGEAAAGPGPARHAPTSAAAPRERPVRGSHRAGRSRSAHRSGRPAR